LLFHLFYLYFVQNLKDVTENLQSIEDEIERLMAEIDMLNEEKAALNRTIGEESNELKKMDGGALAAELAEEIHRHLNGEPITARAPTGWTRATHWIARKPIAAACAAGLVFGATVTVGILIAAYAYLARFYLPQTYRRGLTWTVVMFLVGGLYFALGAFYVVYRLYA